MRKPGRKRTASKRRVNRELVLRALTDRKFRRLLETKPAEVLGKKLTPIQEREVELVLATVRGIESQVHSLADELLCANGPCGIA